MSGEVKKYYDRVAERYDEDINEEYYKYTNFYTLLNWYGLSENFNVLDLGCGTGRFISYLLRYSLIKQENIIGIDFSREMVSAAQRKHKCRIFCMDMEALHFPPYKFDLVTAVGSLERHKRLLPIFCEVRRVLKHNGIFYFNIHHKARHVQLYRIFKKSKKRNWEVNLYKLRIIRWMLREAGFKIEHEKPTYFLPKRFNSWERDEMLGQIPIIRSFSAMLIIGARKI